MTIRYKNTFRDIMMFCFYHYPRSPLTIGVYGIAFVLFTLSNRRTLSGNMAPTTKIIVLPLMELIYFLVLAGIFVAMVFLSMVSRRNKTLLTEHTITFWEGSFQEETPYHKTDYKWTGVQQLARTRQYVFIYVAQHAAHIVPRRAFENDIQWDAFYAFCRERIQGH